MRRADVREVSLSVSQKNRTVCTDKISMEQLMMHDTEVDCWVAVHGKVRCVECCIERIV